MKSLDRNPDRLGSANCFLEDPSRFHETYSFQTAFHGLAENDWLITFFDVDTFCELVVQRLSL